MKKLLLSLLIMLFVGIASAFSQNVDDSIAVNKNKFYYHGMQIESMRQIKSIVANDQLALKEVKKGSVAGGFGYVFAYMGGFALGWEIVDMVMGRTNPVILVSGVALTAAGFGLSFLANSYLKKGVAIYNGNLGATSYGYNVELDFGLVPGGVGLTLSF